VPYVWIEVIELLLNQKRDPSQVMTIELVLATVGSHCWISLLETTVQ
jgi:hypothetical protein